MKEINLDIKCQSCKGTGLYSGIGESEDCAVICNICKGTGCQKYSFEYEPFNGRQQQSNKIKRVFKCNPGIKINSEERFGGMPIKEWEQGLPFPNKSENRNFTCPAWWYQTSDYKKKEKIKWCYDEYKFCCGSFSGCKNFKNKSECWERFDKLV